MLVCLVRHGIAEDLDPAFLASEPDAQTYAQADFHRALTDKGRQRTEQAARGLSTLLDAPPTVILTSPKVRAIQTAEIVGEALGRTPQVLDALMDEGPDGFARVDQALRQLKVGSAMLVGHEPMLGQWASQWLFNDGNTGQAAPRNAPEDRIQFKKSGCLRLQLSWWGDALDGDPFDDSDDAASHDNATSGDIQMADLASALNHTDADALPGPADWAQGRLIWHLPPSLLRTLAPGRKGRRTRP